MRGHQIEMSADIGDSDRSAPEISPGIGPTDSVNTPIKASIDSGEHIAGVGCPQLDDRLRRRRGNGGEERCEQREGEAVGHARLGSAGLAKIGLFARSGKQPSRPAEFGKTLPVAAILCLSRHAI